MRAILLLAVLSGVALALNAPPGTKITSLPSFTGASLPSMYSGYITVNATNGRALFYWLVEATDVDPTTAPLVFWYQGGPGCSGLGGLFTENGPLTPDGNGGVKLRDIHWTRIANVVFLEQPAFVGFSYSNTSSDKNTGDVQATIDNYAFVRGFLDAFPDYRGRDTWFSGESYGGFYVPSLTATVLSNPNTQIYKQFQGFMVGNPVFFCGSIFNNTVQLNTYYWHGLVSYSNMVAWQNNGCIGNQNTAFCVNLWNTIQNQIGVIDQEILVARRSQVPQQPSLDPDDLYQNFCTGNGTLDYVATVPVNCVPLGQQVSNYLNRADVQQAIHAQGPNGGSPLPWTECTSVINYNALQNSLVPLYAKFQQQKPGVKILVYSGDVDIATVPFTYTQPCLAELNVAQTQAWQPWFVNGQTAGYWEQYLPTYTFATIKGAGHEAPQYQPLAAYNMFQRFLNTQSLVDPNGGSRRPIATSRVLREGDILRKVLRKRRVAHQ